MAKKPEHVQDADVMTDEQTIDYVVPDLRHSTRKRNAPDRFGVSVDLDAVLSSDDGFIDMHGYYKVKRFLGQRPHKDTTEYLVQLRGEPAESSVWVPFSSLNNKARDAVQKKPPPVILDLE